MPKMARVAPTTRREWLDSYERGRAIDAIARDAGRTERTVKRQLAIERQERDRERVRVDLLREAYQGHFDDLLGLVKELGVRARQANVHGLWRDTDRRTELLREALKAHIPGSDVWRVCVQWEERARQMNTVERGMAKRIARHVSKWTQECLPKADVDRVAAALWYAVQQSAAGGDVSRTRYKTREVKGELYLWWGDTPICRVCDDDEAKETEETHRKMVTKGTESTSDFVQRWAEVVRKWEEARDAIQEEVEALLLRRILPGQCFLCPGGEGTGAKRGRKRGRG